MRGTKLPTFRPAPRCPLSDPLHISYFRTRTTLPTIRPAPHFLLSNPHHISCFRTRTTLPTLGPAPHFLISDPHNISYFRTRPSRCPLSDPHHIFLLPDPHHVAHFQTRTTFLTLGPTPHFLLSDRHHVAHFRTRTTLPTFGPAPRCLWHTNTNTGTPKHDTQPTFPPRPWKSTSRKACWACTPHRLTSFFLFCSVLFFNYWLIPPSPRPLPRVFHVSGEAGIGGVHQSHALTPQITRRDKFWQCAYETPRPLPHTYGRD